MLWAEPAEPEALSDYSWGAHLDVSELELKYK